jgi:hypothetical protein
LIQDLLGRSLSIAGRTSGYGGTLKYKNIRRSRLIASIVYEIESRKNLVYSIGHGASYHIVHFLLKCK